MKFFFSNQIYAKLQILLLNYFLLFHLTKCTSMNCNKTHPILKNDICSSIYCSEAEYNSSACIINNPIIKTQWLNNINIISEKNFRYINPFLTKNNDLIIQTTNTIGTSERSFYGMTNDGRYYFTNSEGQESPYFSINAVAENSNDIIYKYEGSTTAVQFEDDEKEYFLSLGCQDTYAELIDYRNQTLSRIKSSTLYYVTIVSEKTTIFLMAKMTQDNKKKKYYIIPEIIMNNEKYYFMCKIYTFSSTNIKVGYERVVHQYFFSSNRKITNCFQSTLSYYIFCFYQDDSYNFSIVYFEADLSLTYKGKTEIDLGDNDDNENNIYIFLKGIHLFDDVGFYIYYKSIDSYPIVTMGEYIDTLGIIA